MKKIILFLFGIVLIIFGNKAAIDTIFKNNDGLKTPDSEEKDITDKSPVITEEMEIKEIKETEVITNDNATPSTGISEVKPEEVIKKETSKASTTKPTDKTAKEQSVKASQKKEEPKVKEAPKTEIEPVQEESAAASE